MDERTSFRTMCLLEESRLHATSTIKCVDTISKENIELRMGCHESMNSVDYEFCPAEEEEVEDLLDACREDLY